MASRNGKIRDMLTLPRLNGGSEEPHAQGERLHMYITHAAEGWAVTVGSETKLRVSKSEAKRVAIEWAHDLVASGHTVSLKIAGMDGQFQEERTYPRSSDPSETPG